MTSDYSVAVVGASSMVGSRFCELSRANFSLIESDLNNKIPIDITNEESVNDFYQSHQFDTLILFSAYTDVDASEEQRGVKEGLCWKINVNGVENIAQAAEKFKKNIIFISTDFVFDGTEGPYKEEDEVGGDLEKITWYGISKLEGERLILKLPNFLIIRISFPYRAKFEGKADFARKLLDNIENGLSLYDNQILTPTFIDDVAPAVKLLLEKNQQGIFHLASPETTTPYNFANLLAQTFKKDKEKIKRGKLEEDNSARRPQKGGLLSDKIISMGFRPTSWNEGIKKMATQLSN